MFIQITVSVKRSLFLMCTIIGNEYVFFSLFNLAGTIRLIDLKNLLLNGFFSPIIVSMLFR